MVKLFVLLLCSLSFYCGNAQSRYTLSEELYDSALLAYRAQRYEEAIHYIDSSLHYQQQAKSHFLHGLILERRAYDIRAIASYSAALNVATSFSEARFRRALLYLQYKNPENAILDLNWLLNNPHERETHGVFFRLDPLGSQQTRINTSSGIKADILHYRGQAFEQLDQYDDAIMDYNTTLGLNPDPDVYVSRSLLHLKMGNEILAENDLRKAIQIKPDHQLAWYNLVLLRADVVLPDTMVLGDDFAPMLGWKGAKELEEGHLDLALHYFDAALKIDSLDALLRTNRGRALSKKGHYDMARSDFQKALEINSSAVECWYLIGNTYYLARNFEESLGYYQQYLSIDQQYPIVWFNAAMALLSLGFEEEACHYLTQSAHLGMKEAEFHLKKHCVQ